MPSLKNLKKERKLVQKFLRQRNLTKPFNRFKKIKKSRSQDITVDGVKRNVLIHRKGNTTIIRDKFSLEVLATTKQYNTKNVNTGITNKKIKFKVVQRTVLKNVVQEDRGFPLKRKVGKVFMRIRFYRPDGSSVTTEGGSRKMRLLNVASEREEAKDEAFKGALSQIAFSYERFEIVWIHFSYFIQRVKYRNERWQK